MTDDSLFGRRSAERHGQNLISGDDRRWTTSDHVRKESHTGTQLATTKFDTSYDIFSKDLDRNFFDTKSKSADHDTESHSRWLAITETSHKYDANATPKCSGYTEITIDSRFWGKDTDNFGHVTNYGNANLPPTTIYTPWPPPDQNWADVIAADVAGSATGQWLYNNGAAVMGYIGGAFDIGLGIFTVVGTWGWATVPGIGLMAIGVDQILTTATGGGPSVFQYAGYQGALGLGFSDSTAQMIGSFTPLGMSLGFGAWGAYLNFTALSQVRLNKAAGDAVRDLIAAREAPALIEQTLATVGGPRRIDVLKLGDRLVGIESKVGRTALDSRVRQELARDWWLLRQGKLDGVLWEFSRSGVTGQVGPTKQLLEMLQKLGFPMQINP